MEHISEVQWLPTSFQGNCNDYLLALETDPITYACYPVPQLLPGIEDDSDEIF